ncbi:hypothetical protein F3J17_04855 [Burkholderia sp. Ax-1719]|nr:hypothetical protein [Burkholderia sp. Ax-1719]
MLGAHSVLADSQSSYDDCLLYGLRDSRNGAVTQMIKGACYALYENGEMLLPRERAYNVCLLQNLPGARDPFAIAQIKNVCSHRSEM